MRIYAPINSVSQTFQPDAKTHSLRSPPLSPTSSVHSTRSLPHHYPPAGSTHPPTDAQPSPTYTHQKTRPTPEPKPAATKRHPPDDSKRVRRRGNSHRVLRHPGPGSVSCVRARGQNTASRRTLSCRPEVGSPLQLRGWTKRPERHRR